MLLKTLYPMGLLLALLAPVLASPVDNDYVSPSMAPLYIPPAPAHDLINNSYIVMFRDDVLPSVFTQHMNFLELAKEAKGVSASDVQLEHMYNSEIAKGYAALLTPEILELIRSRPEVKYVEQVQVMYADDIQNKPPWGLARINHKYKLDDLHFHYAYPSDSGAGVLVYVIDSGVNIQHAEFEGRARWGKTFFPGEGHADGSGHGSHVAGTIASRAYGVAKKAEIVAVKVLNAQGSGNTAVTLQGLEYVLRDSREQPGGKYKGFVVNMSLGGARSRASEDGANSAVRAGLHVVTAAGNDNVDACLHSPASAELPITVGSSTREDTKRPSSNHGKCVDVFAPGSDTLSVGNTGRDSTAIKSGTSMAAPHVAGMIAQFLSIYPHWSFNPRSASVSEDTSFESRLASALTSVHESLPGFLSYLLPSASHRTPLDSQYPMQAATLTPQVVKKALLGLAVKGALTGGLPPGTPNLLAYNNYTHGLPGHLDEEPFALNYV